MEPLHSLLLEAGDVELRWNVEGVDGEGHIDADRLRVHLFTVDLESGKAGFDAPLDSRAVSKLHDFLRPFADELGAGGTQGAFRVVEMRDPLEDILSALPHLDPTEFLSLVKAVADPDKLSWLAENLGQVELTQMEASIRQMLRERALDDLDAMIAEDSDEEGDLVALCERDARFEAYRAGQPETVFQRWFEANTWVFGREYVRRHSLRVVGLESEADLILETTDGYLDLIELKRPRAGLLNHKAGVGAAKGFHYPHSDLSLAYGQCVRYLADLETFRLELQERYDARIIAPRIILVAGRSAKSGSDESDALRRVAATFHQIEVLTFDQILDIGHQLIRIPTDETGT